MKIIVWLIAVAVFCGGTWIAARTDSVELTIMAGSATLLVLVFPPAMWADRRGLLTKGERP